MNPGEVEKLGIKNLYIIPSTGSTSMALDASGFGAVKVGTEDPVLLKDHLS